MYRIGREEIDALARVINQAAVSRRMFKTDSDGAEVYHFEKEFSEKIGAKHTLMVTSGMGALVSGLTAMGVGPGDEVIVPAYTFIASAIAVTAVGAIPVICDIDETMTMNPADVEKKISRATKAIMPVHIQGFPCDMDALCALAKKHGIYILEDACQADGGSYKGKRFGAIGDAGTFSFNAYKIITAGEGGAFTTNDRVLFERALIHQDSSGIAFFGNQLDGITEPQFCGGEFRANELSAAVLRVQLQRLDGILADLRKHKKEIMRAAGGVKWIRSNDIEGDCGTTLACQFDDAERAEKFASASGVGGRRPINTGRHVYTNWTPLLQKRGAFHPALDPFKMKENAGLNFNITPDACLKTLDLLARTVYMDVNPDWTAQDVENKIKALNAAM